MDAPEETHPDRRHFETAWELPEPGEEIIDLAAEEEGSDAPAGKASGDARDRFAVGWAVEDVT